MLSKEELEKVYNDFHLVLKFEQAHGGLVADSWPLHIRTYFIILIESIIQEERLDNKQYDTFKKDVKSVFLRKAIPQAEVNLSDKLDDILDELERKFNDAISAPPVMRP